jgi:addiction module HigA family antidote
VPGLLPECVRDLIMLPKNRVSTHPGIILLEEFLKHLGRSQIEFARHIGIPIQRVNEIIRQKRGVSPESAWLFAQAFGTTPEFWMNLQSQYDLSRNRPVKKVKRLRSKS